MLSTEEGIVILAFVIVLFLKLLHHRHTVLEAELVGSSHLRGAVSLTQSGSL